MGSEPNEYHLVAFDPGGTVGWAHLVFDCRAFSRPSNKALRYLKRWECGEYAGTENEQVGQASRLIWRAKFGDMPYNSTTDVVVAGLSRADVLSEDFELTQLIGGNNLLSPVRINAKLDWECHRWGLKLNLQRRSMRTAVTAERLIAFGFTSPFRRNGEWSSSGSGKDAFSAMQHAVTWLRRVKDKSKSQPWRIVVKGQTLWDCPCAKGGRCNFRHPR